MTVVENAGVELGRSTVGSAVPNQTSDMTHPPSNQEPSQDGETINGQDDQAKLGQAQLLFDHHHLRHHHGLNDQSLNLYEKVAAEIGAHHHNLLHHRRQVSGGGDFPASGDDHNQHLRDAGERFNRDMRELSELFSKLNPMAKEFVPPSLSNGNNHHHSMFNGGGGGFFPNNGNRNGNANGFAAGRRNNQGGKRRINSRTSMAQREDRIRRTVYVSDIDQQVTEEQLAALFITCGQVVDCRICGDPNSVLRFAFIEFTDEEGARASLSLAGTMLGFYPVRVLPSKTAIAPVNPTFLPRTDDEREICARTIYCTNIDKKVTQADVKLFFESVCGEVYRIRLLGDHHHSTRIAFVEFIMAESAIAALNCSGVVLGSSPIRVSPSKTPVRPRAPRLPMH